jgi:O-antigen/teichoic acid export membrane protein
MYPVVCAVQDRVDLLYESFQKSNRVALIWAVPFGVGLTLFAADLVNYGIGTRWRPAIPLLAIFGVTAALAHVGFNWDQYYRARGDTRPIAWATAITTVAFLASAIPLLYIWGLKGFAVGVAIQALVNLVELFVFAAITVVATWALERRLLGEMAGYLRRSRAEAEGLGDTGAPANTGEPLPRAGVASEGGA